MGLRAGLDVWEKSRPSTENRSPDRPVRNQSLYRLSYPAHLMCWLVGVFLTLQTRKYLVWDLVFYVNISPKILLFLI
jgi:hypothetical protein